MVSPVLPKPRGILHQKSAQIMGVLNVTEDSFYDGGRYNTLEKALKRVQDMIREGADIIDIGAESSRPLAHPVAPNIECDQVVSMVKAIRLISDIPLSVDTTHAMTAREALQSGADIINDISALQHDPEMIQVIRDFNCPVVLMHMRGNPMTMQSNTQYDDLIFTLRKFFQERIEFIQSHGVLQKNIILDPGIGFGKSVAGNLLILKNLDQIFPQFPILMGASRKSFIGHVLDVPVEERLMGSLASIAAGFYRGVQIYRVHDVKETKNFLKMLETIENVPRYIE